ncbi:hypothetical protein [Glycomyces terrestris]|uniref:Ricin B lectin domain-containing protein n=1 Tax=Glycomyces terrestris TaxID=2493553 RepID=A0A426V5E5_9ACTN|nr:hypothetical protein [Glycomyces terrestris]RRS02129.1 hypothetical protein EIW28_05215 [Glycomyces terrestris]
MKALVLRVPAVAVLALTAWAAPVSAAPLPEGAATLFLKEHRELPLAVEDGRAVLAAEPDLWTLRPVEALQDLGGHHIVHDDTGQCLTADTSGGEEVVPVVLADCADAAVWRVVHNDLSSQDDLRFITDDDYFLGLPDDVDPAPGALVVAVDPESGQSHHSQEWRFSEPPQPSPSPSEPAPTTPPVTTPPPEASSEPTTPPAAPQLPTTGAGLGVAVGGGAVALAGGSAAVLWWQRRRALRHHW